MKIEDTQLTALEDKGYIVIQSDFPEIAYAVDQRRRVMWSINRQTGHQQEISAENVHKYADELMSVSEIYLGVQPMEKGA